MFVAWNSSLRFHFLVLFATNIDVYKQNMPMFHIIELKVLGGFGSKLYKLMMLYTR